MASLAALLRRCLPPLNFITLHYAYFVAVCLAASVVFYCSSDPAWSISYTDSLFLVVSAMTEAGLNTVNLSQMTTWQQVLLWLLILAGGSVWVSMWTVLARRTVFARRYGHVVTAETTQGQILAARPPDTAHRATLHRLLARGRSTDAQQFGPLSREEREHLGRVEYRALGVLAVLVPLYLVLWQVLGSVGLGAWLSRHRADVPRRNGIGPWWLGVFNAVSAFNNSGMSLLDANMVPFQDAHYLLLTMGLLILAGNTAYPVFLRLAVWALLRLADRATPAHVLADWKDTLLFILRYPRRVYTNLFPARATWWLVFMLVLLNSLDWMAFELLNLGNPTVETIPLGSRIVDGLFQALAVRSGGFYVVSIAGLYIGTQITYVIMMYISVYPVVITMRHSNVYEERSLGIYSDAGKSARSHSVPAALGRRLQRTLTLRGVGVPPAARRSHAPPESRADFITQQIRSQLAHDLWLLVLAVLVISTIETARVLADPVAYSVFNVVFEVVSGYGTVGISVGLPGAAYSFAGGWHAASKLVLCAVMLRGRHRGLPVALDRAVRWPGEQLGREEEEDWRIRRRLSRGRERRTWEA